MAEALVMIGCLFLVCTEETGPLDTWSESLLGLIVKLLDLKPIMCRDKKAASPSLSNCCIFAKTISRLLLEFRQGNSRWHISLLNHPRHHSHIHTHPPKRVFNISRAQAPQSRHSPRRFHPLGFDNALLWNPIWSRSLCYQTPSLHASEWRRSDTAGARKQHESLRKHVPLKRRWLTKGGIQQLNWFAATSGWGGDGVETSGHTWLLPYKTHRGHCGDLLTPLPLAKHIVLHCSCLAG